MARPLGGGKNDVDRLLARAEIRREAALVADGSGEPALVQQALQRVEDLGADLQRLGERARPRRHDHELLEVEGVRGVRAAVDDVHHRHGEHDRLLPAQRAVERQARVGRGRLRHGERHAEQGVRAERALVRRAVELDQAAVDRCLIARVETLHGRAELGDDVADRPQDALAEVRLRIAVAQLDRLVLAGGSPRRDGGATERARLEDDVDLDRRVAARVEDLPRRDALDGAHASPSSTRSMNRRLAPRRASSESTFSADATATTPNSTSPSASIVFGSGSVSGGGVPAPPQLRAKLVELFVEAGQTRIDVRKGKAGRRRPPLHLSSIEQRRQRLREVVEDALSPLLLGLQLLPAVLDRLG